MIGKPLEAFGQPVGRHGRWDRDTTPIRDGENLRGFMRDLLSAYGKDAGIVIAQSVLEEREHIM